MKIKKILSVILSILIIFSFCSFSVSAADGTEPIDINDMSYTCYEHLDVDGVISNVDVTDYVIENGIVTKGIFSGLYKFSFPYNVDYTFLMFTLDESFSINSEHEYNLSFDWGYDVYQTGQPEIFVYLNYLDSSGNEIKQQLLVQQDGIVNELNSVNVDFKADVSDIKSGYLCNFTIFYHQSCSGTKTEGFYISPEINLIDKDDDSGWFQKIINKIEETINNIKQIPEKINQKLAELKDGIGEFFEGLGEDIKGFFDMLKNFLLYFQHPVELNSEGVLVDENGEPIYTNPFESALSDVQETVNSWIDDIMSFVKSMDESRVEVSGYLEIGTGFINDIMSAHPILSACVLFAAAFFVIRKVVGR